MVFGYCFGTEAKTDTLKMSKFESKIDTWLK